MDTQTLSSAGQPPAELWECQSAPCQEQEFTFERALSYQRTGSHLLGWMGATHQHCISLNLLCWPFHSQERSISNFPCSLTRKITSHSMKKIRTWLSIAYSDERWLIHYQFSLPPERLDVCALILNLGVKGLTSSICIDQYVNDIPVGKGSVILLCKIIYLIDGNSNL